MGSMNEVVDESGIIYSESGIDDLCYNSGNRGHVFGGRVHADTQTIALYFRDLSYQTANIGKFSKHPTYEFICHITGCKPDRQPEAYHPYWDSWVALGETDECVGMGLASSNIALSTSCMI
ncbi:MAG: hypothetical protein GY809_29055 [Planctomycetes bacterium]|nr:hypothetical protein [Planctomycetota bacterium]